MSLARWELRPPGPQSTKGLACPRAHPLGAAHPIRPQGTSVSRRGSKKAYGDKSALPVGGFWNVLLGSELLGGLEIGYASEFLWVSVSFCQFPF